MPTKPTTKKPAIQRKSKKNRGNNSSEDYDKTAGHLKKEDYLIIIEWLKIKQNYNSCFGTGILLLVVQQKINPISTKTRICTINEKLESMCPHYHAMNNLMGGQAFINPWLKVDAQADHKTATSSPSEPA
ncbi:uncharacterized protein VP01_3890g2 [Puccinia sorghi]|uniref:Uncharacterized protein n=1 Tax=Puccinia sorghi TaxID=27349 RepID=A0A0L6UUQ4_9BASI|nr:uncharacterized protein VP01_3890g2 [Puccinia sorghi]